MVTKTGTERGELIEGEEGNDHLSGLGGNDRIFGYGGNDLIYGGAGGDRLYGGLGADQIYGGTDNDFLLGEGGDDDLFGETGADTLRGEAGNDYLEGGDGDDTLDGGLDNDGTVTITLGAGGGIATWNFSINSNFGGMFGGAGSDTINGGDGNDVALGGYDRDYLYGDEGNDLTIGGGGGDQLRGGNGHDVLIGDTLAGLNFGSPVYVGGTGGDDDLDGGEGDDMLYGGAFNDILTGGAGIDFLYGGMGPESSMPSGWVDGVDQLYGGDHDDVLRGGDGDDRLYGEGAEDNMRGDRGNDLIDGGDGDDLAAYRFDDVGLTAGVVFSALAVGRGTREVQIDDRLGGIDTLVSVERIQVNGSAFADEITGGGMGDFLYGQNGGDTIWASAGDDVVDGGGGDDAIDGGMGDDELIGGEGLDRLVYRLYDYDTAVGAGALLDASAIAGGARTLLESATIGADWVSGFEGLDVTCTGLDDTIVGSQLLDTLDGGRGADTLDGQSGNDLIRGGEGKDTILGGDGLDELHGDEGNDVIDGGDGIDAIAGGDGHDRLIGGDGADVLTGGTGRDTLEGGQGDDTYELFADDEGDRVVEARGAGTDTLRSAMFETVAGANVERIELVGEAVYATGNTLDNEIIGTDGENILRGGRGDDVIEGRGGADTLYSGGGIDTLVGGTGSDTYYVENAGVTIVELADEGDDIVYSAIRDYTLEEEVEDLVLLGNKALHGTGNLGDNEIQGNHQSNRLRGLGGDDILWGGINAESDILEPGTGADTIVVRETRESTSLWYDLVIGMNLDEDVFDIGFVPTAVSRLEGGRLRAVRFGDDLAAILDPDILGVGEAILFDPSRGSFESPRTLFLVVDTNGVAGYQDGFDIVIGLESAVGQITLADFV